MSNLKLPTLTFSALGATIRGDRPTKIAYETTAQWQAGNIVVKHHGSVIATLAPQYVYVSNAGWSSKTTVMRLHRILKDNGIPFGIAIRQGATALLGKDLKVIEHGGAFAFEKSQGVWERCGF